MSPNLIRKRKVEKQSSERMVLRDDSDDEDATFNELMGRFDESYVYEKETDILSDDSDPTECASDLDTGQEGSDEYDTDEQLDIEYIDTGSIQEVFEKGLSNNTGSCKYYDNQSEKRLTSFKKIRKQNHEENGSRRRRFVTRQRKRIGECIDKQQSNYRRNSTNARESRSVGSTPVSERRNKSSKHIM